MSRLSVPRFVDGDCYLSVQRGVFSWMVIALLLVGISAAQNSDPDGGSPPFITSVNGQLDQFNLPSGNILIQLPVRSKAGKYPTTFSLVGNSHAYIGPPPQNSNYSGVWNISYGFTGVLSGSALANNVGAVARATNLYSLSPCLNYPDTMYANWVVVEPNGTQHPFAQAGQSAPMVDIDGCVYSSASGTTVDGSGYTISINVVNKSLKVSLWDKSGNLLEAPTLPTSCDGTALQCATDADGISMYGPTISGFYGAAVDTLGQTIVNVGQGNGTYSYTDVNDNTQQVQIDSSPFGVHTNFGCTNYWEPPIGGSYLPTSIVYPDGETVKFSYESIPMPPPNVWAAKVYIYPGTSMVDSNHNVEGTSGGGTTGSSQPAWNTVVGGQTVDGSVTWQNYGNISITGRLASITYPQGGSVSYNYSGSFCLAGTHTITRTVNDNNGNSNTWIYQFTYTTYSQNHNITLTETVTETDPAGNVTILYYGGGCNSNLVCGVSTSPTQILSYQGAASASTLIAEQIICYNNNNSTANGCINPAPGAAPPFSQVDTYTYVIGSNGALGSANDVQVKYDSYGNVTSNATYDYGVAFPPSGTPLSTTTTTYNTGSTCGTLAVAAMKDRPCSITTYRSGTMVQQVTYTYSAAGHPTQTFTWTGGSNYLTSSASYNSNGSVATSTTPSGLVSTYAYNGISGCNNLLPTSVTSYGLGSSTLWSCNGGVQTQTKDYNQQHTYYAYNDPMWRVTSVTDPLGNVVSTSYGTNTVENKMSFGSSVEDVITTFDGIGRRIRTQSLHGSSYDTVSYKYGYNSTGATISSSVPCSEQLAKDCLTGFMLQALDAVGGTLSTVDGGGGALTNVYNQNDVIATLSPAPSGEKNKITQEELDGLGRLKSLCSILSSGGSSCGQVAGGSGVSTLWAYTTAVGSTTVTAARGSETRSKTFDALGRITSETNPEWGATGTTSGTKQYWYGTSSPDCNGSTQPPGDLLEEKDAAGRVVCHSHDIFDRTVSFSSGNGGLCSVFAWDSTTTPVAQKPPTGYVGNNLAGRIAEAYTANCSQLSSVVTDEWFSYDALGNVTDVWELSPSAAGSYVHTFATWYPNGQLNTLNSSGLGTTSGITGIGSLTYGLDANGRPSTAMLGTTPIVAGVTYGPIGSTTIDVGAGTDQDAYTYDQNTGRMTGYQFNVGSANMKGMLTWNTDGMLGQLAITDGFNSGGTQICTFGYDDVSRLTSDGCGSVWTQTFIYDQYDNLTKSGSSSWNPGYNTKNQYANIGAAYDASGNLTYDGLSHYAWDTVDGKLLGVNTDGAVNCGASNGGDCITYDAFGRALEINQNGSLKLIALYSPVGQLGLVYNYLNQGIIYVYTAQIPVPGGGILGEGGGAFYVHRDWLGSSRIAQSIPSSGNGSVAYDYAFAPYGEVYDTFGVPPSSAAYSFTADWEYVTGGGGVLFDTPNRELNSIHGRWISTDPAGAGWNLYAYATNPNSEVDPTGLDCAYLNDAGDGPDPSGLDHNSNPLECKKNGGQWLEGTIQDGTVGANPDNGQVWGKNSNGFTVTNDPAQSVTADGDYSAIGPIGAPNNLGRPSTCAGRTSADLNYNVPNSKGETGQQHIERLHMALVNGSPVPNMKSQYLFSPPGTPSQNWALVMSINAYTFTHANQVSQNGPNGNIVFTGQLPPEFVLPGYQSTGPRPLIGMERQGSLWGLPIYRPTNVNTLVTQSDCISVRSSYTGSPN
jgi:RHS repeat-associated protein